MLVGQALYGLKSSGAAHRAFFAEDLYDLGYKYSVADSDVWLRPAIKEKDFSSTGNTFNATWTMYCAKAKIRCTP